ncbi:MAG: aldo/keto reductase [bacterium]|nr:aldo/keto reductase [bacterium]
MNKEDFEFSPLIIGTMRLGKWGVNYNQQQTQEFIEECLAMDLVDFDLADIYGDYTTETEFGDVLRSNSSLRDKLRITTKCGIRMAVPNKPENTIKSYDSSPEHIVKSVNQSLKSLGTDYIDLLLIHRPDYLMNPEEIAKTFDQLKQEGKVLHFGVSNFSVSQFDLLNDYVPLKTNQIEVSILHREPFEQGELHQCLKHKIRPTAWSPFGGGEIFNSSTTDTTIKAIRETASNIGKKYDAGLFEVLLAWLSKHPSGVIPVLGTSKTDRIKLAKNSLDLSITSEEWYALWQAAIGGEIA